MLKQVRDCRLIIIDPIGSAMGGRTDAHRDNEVRAVLSPVAKLAEQYGVAVLVVCHTRKAAASHADDLTMGSRAFTGIARAVWHVSKDGEDEARRFFLAGKNNLGPPMNGLAFGIINHCRVGQVVWEREPVTMSADDALAIENRGGGDDDNKPGPKPKVRDAAADWLAELLANGELATAKIMEEAKAAGLAWRTVQRAGDALGIIREKNTFHGGWQWRFPKPGAEDAKSACQVPKEEDNLASWHLRKKQGENGDSACQVTEDAKLIYLGTLGDDGEPDPENPIMTRGAMRAIRAKVAAQRVVEL